MSDAGTSRQQIVDKIKEASNILVTVSTNPSVDELSAALGLTLMLNKLKKHATAVFSGDVPPAITFLDPEKTFENTVDSLRDFIIALDKEKADHLRYKVDGDVVKIFITPYRTTISDADLEYSQGDYNVELVLGLGVTDSEHLDKALEAHGRILHDATVATLSVGSEVSKLGSIDWNDESASSLSEMLVSISEAIKSDKPLLDEQISTALLTGIVAATDRFSNDHTSSKVMTMAAQLMAAGANQQLIASKLEDAHEIAPEAKTTETQENSDGTTNLSEDTSTKVEKKAPKKDEPAQASSSDDAIGALAISHEPAGDLDNVAKQIADQNTNESKELVENKLESADDAGLTAEQKLEADLNASIPQIPEAPALGGTLNATTEQAENDTRKEVADDRNKTILSHNPEENTPANKPITDEPQFQAPFNAASGADTSEPPTVDPFTNVTVPAVDPVAPSVATPSSGATLADIDAANRVNDETLAAVHAAFGQNGDSKTPAETTTPTATGLPPLPDFSTLPPPPPVLPDFSQPPAATTPSQPTGALPPEKLADIFASESPTPVVPPADDPGQFKIPGQ
ncbi:MAG: hypothetical protein ABJA64_02220 [Candidatus Saccharibacteria bacterium]